jgi:acyl-CoA synthetase (AMP-forming)/AMP-acid ligase II
MARGATTVILDRADPDGILDAIERRRVTILFLPPTVIYGLLGRPDIRTRNFRSLRNLIYSAAPMSADKLDEAIEIFGPVMTQAYGQTEAPLLCTFMSPEEHLIADDADRRKRLLSCGRATPFVTLEIMDDAGRLLSVGETGEIVVRGNLVMKGYADNPQETAKVSEFGWHHTGDVGYRDSAGYLYIVDRKKDMIISGGFNIYPSEIEQVLWSHPAVQDCAVIGVPDGKWGEAVKAIVELKPAISAREDELVSYCKARLGGLKAPKSLEIWPELPRSAVGKVLKRAIRDRYWTGRERQV